jgi:hypothetical protein
MRLKVAHEEGVQKFRSYRSSGGRGGSVGRKTRRAQHPANSLEDTAPVLSRAVGVKLGKGDGTSTERLKTGAESFQEQRRPGRAEFFALPTPRTSFLTPRRRSSRCPRSG